MKQILRFIFVLVLSSMGFITLHAQAIIPPAVWVYNNTIIYDDGTGGYPSFETREAVITMAWNEEGDKLAFVTHHDDTSRSGYVGIFDTLTGEANPLNHFETPVYFELSWMQDGRLLYAMENPDINPELGIRDQIDIFAADLQPDGSQVRLATIKLGGGCGGGSSIPADWLYWREAGVYTLTLQETPYGILYNTTCSGSEYALLNPETGESSEPFAANIEQMSLSANGEQLAGVEFLYDENNTKQLIIMTLADGAKTVIPTEETPQLVTWSFDETALYYVTQQYEGNLYDNLSDEDKATLTEKVMQEMSYIPAYTATVRRIDLTTGEDTQVYEADAYAIARLKDTAEALYISQIPNLAGWLAAILRGDETYSWTLNSDFVRVATFRYDYAEGGDVAFMGYYQQFTPFVEYINIALGS